MHAAITRKRFLLKGWSLPYTFTHGLGHNQNDVKGQEVKNSTFNGCYIIDHSSISCGQRVKQSILAWSRVKCSNGGSKIWTSNHGHDYSIQNNHSFLLICSSRIKNVPPVNFYCSDNLFTGLKLMKIIILVYFK